MTIHRFISALVCHMTWLSTLEIGEQVTRVILSGWLHILDLLGVPILIATDILSLILTTILILKISARRLQNRT
ncbi:unnamed protein product [Lupinus luteus]|uniref:Uncharacterized protein n=1 Tax=Lupinus luteus TaxID=3873 RepID=A0AAV1YEN8_LUPLU